MKTVACQHKEDTEAIRYHFQARHRATVGCVAIKKGKVMKSKLSIQLCAIVASAILMSTLPAQAADDGLWKVYNEGLKGAKYIDLSHTIQPKMPVGGIWHPDLLSN